MVWSTYDHHANGNFATCPTLGSFASRISSEPCIHPRRHERALARHPDRRGIGGVREARGSRTGSRVRPLARDRARDRSSGVDPRPPPRNALQLPWYGAFQSGSGSLLASTWVASADAGGLRRAAERTGGQLAEGSWVMTLSDLGDLGDFLGGIGVIVTLVYLAFQIRANTRAVQSASLDAVATSHFEIQKSLGIEPGLAKIWYDGLKGRTGMPEEESQRFTFLLLSVARQWERAFYKGRAGALESGVWAGIEAEWVAIFRNPGARRGWEMFKRGFSTDFVSHVESAIRSGG